MELYPSTVVWVFPNLSLHYLNLEVIESIVVLFNFLG